MADHESTIADTLGITEGAVVWIVGQTIEEETILDPLPEGATTLRDAEELEDGRSFDAVLIAIDDQREVAEVLDEVLPQIGSVPTAWIFLPVARPVEVVPQDVSAAVEQYGWVLGSPVRLDDTWQAYRLSQP
ncbi:hypothetical protein ASD11_11955 [Aeromicrobium sp. Root495]|uniref:DUF3052 family protein n=1 Tax=Aeromicrobium sp. Root495 TaxID=1736550 RepID=UPI000701A531|nr:DUF3052 family protein [Aeromicrobium sp. Root495]KQY60181.1 hypothetical protein ASD11_11955 [Aeromicrobium sp. Root495]RYJ06853.1 MAG: DUF3052 family protein [Actinomycetales bacterium]